MALAGASRPALPGVRGKKPCTPGSAGVGENGVRALSAMDKDKLHSLGITHILNAAHHTKGVSTDAQYYKGLPITYFGLKTLDERTFDMSCFFGPASKFIDMGLRTPGGK
ncbi:hypothetical protein NDU88_010750 [Pleurodeles waltl]|uniref:Protein-serine/threonine phosphatase n=1 Tax=Pleurodeles waltl TaxID=8319 RepID=A0AAV7QYE4_PLEWA|nr:hypothetical protein NDU88_010750 [Pleurodeles waltl]